MTSYPISDAIIEEARTSGLNAHLRTPRKPWFSYTRRGGLRFLKIGRFGASFYIARRAA